MRLSFQALRQLGDKSGFADARLAGDQQQPALAGLYMRPFAEQSPDLGLAPDKWCRPRTQSLEAVDRATLGDDPPGMLRLGKAGTRLWTEVLYFEQGADLAAGAVGDDHAIRLGERL
jgi:hypothetical protein